MKTFNYLMISFLMLGFSSLVAGQAANMQTAALKKSATSPSIDGDPTEWAAFGFYEIKNICTGDKSKPITDTYGYWQGAYDDDYLYIHVSVTDDEFATEEDLKDILEIYVDMNHNKAEGGPNPESPHLNGPAVGPATQYAWQWADPTLEFNDPALFATGGLGEGSDTLVVWARKNKGGNLGYELEVAFPWNSLKEGFVPNGGVKISWDIDIADIDPGDEVKSDQYWSNDGTGSADPDLRAGLWWSVVMSGDIELSSETQNFPSQVGIIKYPEASGINLFPNPVKDQLNITHVAGIDKAELYNICGQLVYSEVLEFKTHTTMDLSFCDSGVYFLKLTDSRSNIRSIKIIKQ